MRLFCLPHAGGGASEFHPWAASLPASVQLCSVQLPGRETRFAENSYAEINPLVDAIARELHSSLEIPYAVFGHSMGALLAYEWVRRIQRDGQPMPAWLFLSGRNAPDYKVDPRVLHTLPDAEFLTELNRIYQGIPEEFLSDPDVMAVFLPILRADVSVVESYRFQDGNPLDCPITVFAGIEDSSVTWDRMLAWQRHTHRRFAAHVLPGGHFYPRGPMLQTLSATLAILLP